MAAPALALQPCVDPDWVCEGGGGEGEGQGERGGGIWGEGEGEGQGEREGDEEDELHQSVTKLSGVIDRGFICRSVDNSLS